MAEEVESKLSTPNSEAILARNENGSTIAEVSSSLDPVDSSKSTISARDEDGSNITNLSCSEAISARNEDGPNNEDISSPMDSVDSSKSAISARNEDGPNIKSAPYSEAISTRDEDGSNITDVSYSEAVTKDGDGSNVTDVSYSEVISARGEDGSNITNFSYSETLSDRDKGGSNIAGISLPANPVNSSNEAISGKGEDGSDVTNIPSSANPVDSSKLTNGGGRQTMTMREILNELNNDWNESKPRSGFSNGKPGGSEIEAEAEHPSSRTPQRYAAQDDVSMELINSVSGVDEEGRSRQRVLAFAAKRYASAIEANPVDYDAFYNWALVLQESADNVASDSDSPSKDALLEEACKKYDEATRLCPTLHDAFYNWAIAVSDRAKMRGRTKEAEELWKEATKKYEKAVQLNWNSPQALNNWGLALQELSAIIPAREKVNVVRAAISKFRSAIQLQFDFHRAIYNLGTVLYGLAEDTLRAGKPSYPKDVSPNELYSQSAIYIAAAHALKPNYSVYCSALRLVRSMLPLPYLKVGHLLAPPAGDSLAPHRNWKRSMFVLNHEGLHQANRTDEAVHTSAHMSGKLLDTSDKALKIDVADIVSVKPCADLTLPPGAGLSIDTIHGSSYFVVDSWEVLDGWLDALRLVYTIYSRGRSDILAGVITG